MNYDSKIIEVLEEKFHEEMKIIEDSSIGVAVSGGGDSLALLLLASKWAKSSKKILRVVTVDHHLREESKDEALYVRTVSHKLGLEHEILDWICHSRKGNLQAEASLARKRLICGWANEHAIATVLLGHTIEDQAENFLMRLARGSGVDGLSGMKRLKKLFGKLFFRPLLSFQRVDLRHYLCHQNIKWVDDPSNEDMKFTRIKARKILKNLQYIGVNPRVIVETANRMEKATFVLNDAAKDIGKKYLRLRFWGDVEVDRQLFKMARNETYLRLLAHLIKWISGNIYRPRYNELNDFALELNKKTFKARTFGGVIARSLDKKKIVLRREASVPTFITQVPAKKFIWDGRWKITLTSNQLGHLEKIGPLGDEGLAQVRENFPTSIPKEGLRSVPTLFCNGLVVASPLLSFGKGLTCKLNYTKNELINSLNAH
mgnify:CR=1 FL=1